ncbi:hypothetical protein X474_24855 [Dethiosulfatarculus sandiegensis]|uniref:Uncharacterized protein n=1 Tax=Dethiosulfatarculus sandiegensis TaxID=1429043 RepID=A0A0D2J7B1_9BACT|nr:hypothetical protein X474_24855 [Dethiosulfatarculus sandiegensis]
MPYYDPEKPYVNFWFASTNGSTIDRFKQALSKKNQDLLGAQSGLCLISTHFAKGFTEKGKINPQFKTLMTRLAKKKAGLFLCIKSWIF